MAFSSMQIYAYAIASDDGKSITITAALYGVEAQGVVASGQA